MGPTQYHFGESFFTVFDDGTGPTLYRGDNLERVLIRWGPSGWQPVSMAGAPAGFEPYAPLVLDRGAGAQLHLTGPVGSEFYLLYWTGAAWANSGICSNTCPGFQLVGGGLMSVNLGDGPKLYAWAYRPFNADTFVVRWDDTQWTEIGAAMNRAVTALVPFDDGTGLALYAIGDFSNFSGVGVPARGMVKWNGQFWSAPMPPQYRVDGRYQAVVADLGDGPAIYSDSTVLINGSLHHWLNKWDGQNWMHVGHPDQPPPPHTPAYVSTLCVFDDGRGPALYIGGGFASFSGVPARNVVRYTPASGFEPLGAGVSGDCTRLYAIRDQRGPALYLGSDFMTSAGGGLLRQSGVLWVGCPNCYANCDLATSPSTLNVSDFVCFLQKFAARDPYANCDLDATINVNDFVCFSQKFAGGCQ